MRYEWDPAKAEANIVKHGVSFEDAVDFAWNEAVGWTDQRLVYGEMREVAVARLRGRLHVMVYTRRGDRLRIISLRKANLREIANYEQIFAR